MKNISCFFSHKGGGALKLFNSTEFSYSGISAVKKAEEDCRTDNQTNYPDDCGRMSVFSIFPGVQLIFDDFDTTNCYCGTHQNTDVMEINYCHEGRSECELQNGFYRYLGQGDLSVNSLNNHAVRMGFPLGHYKGVTVMIHTDILADVHSEIFLDLPVNIETLRDRLCPGNECSIMRARDTLEHTFSDLYNIPASIQQSFFRLKILELLLYLSAIDVSDCNEKREYFPKQLAETVKQIKTRITDEPEKRHTVESLAEEYGISRTTLKSCFKGIYGTSIGRFMRNYRIQAAAALLTGTNRSVLEIAGCVGYENQSRFTAAFKSVIGKKPLQYRNMSVRTD
jgi:AraC-like DNA-binding protein